MDETYRTLIETSCFINNDEKVVGIKLCNACKVKINGIDQSKVPQPKENLQKRSLAKNDYSRTIAELGQLSFLERLFISNYAQCGKIVKLKESMGTHQHGLYEHILCIFPTELPKITDTYTNVLP